MPIRCNIRTSLLVLKANRNSTEAQRPQEGETETALSRSLKPGRAADRRPPTQT